jgi:peptidylprolyl isomerase
VEPRAPAQLRRGRAGGDVESRRGRRTFPRRPIFFLSPVQSMLRRLLLSAAATLTLATAAACGGDGDSPAEPVYSDPVAAVYAPETGVNIAAMTRSSTGLYVQDLVVGTGATAASTSTVTVTYTGRLPNGRVFDSRTTRFSLGGVVAGFSEGIAGMRVGGKRKLVLPPNLGYGARGSADGSIPPNSVIVFDVELVSIP